jgi:hypothetical protein
MLERVFYDINPDMGIEDEYKGKKDKVYQFKLLRSISVNDIKLFFNHTDGDIEKIAKDMVCPNI